MRMYHYSQTPSNIPVAATRFCATVSGPRPISSPWLRHLLYTVSDANSSAYTILICVKLEPVWSHSCSSECHVRARCDSQLVRPLPQMGNGRVSPANSWSVTLDGIRPNLCMVQTRLPYTGNYVALWKTRLSKKSGYRGRRGTVQRRLQLF